MGSTAMVRMVAGENGGRIYPTRLGPGVGLSRSYLIDDDWSEVDEVDARYLVDGKNARALGNRKFEAKTPLGRPEIDFGEPKASAIVGPDIDRGVHTLQAPRPADAGAKKENTK